MSSQQLLRVFDFHKAYKGGGGRVKDAGEGFAQVGFTDMESSTELSY